MFKLLFSTEEGKQYKYGLYLLFADPLLVLIEYIPYGDLLGYLRKSRGLNDTYYKDPDIKPDTNLRSEQLMRFAWQIADGMKYLSSKKVRKEHKRYVLKTLMNKSAYNGDHVTRNCHVVLKSSIKSIKN